MEFTQKLNLKKPGFTDSILITDINENMDVIDAAVSELQEGATSIPDLETADKTLAGAINEVAKEVTTNKQAITDHVADDKRHLNDGEREKWNNEFSTFKSEKDDNSTFKKVEKKRNDGSLFATSVFSNPNADGNYLIRTYTEYANDGTTAIKTIVYDLLYDVDGDWVSEVKRL